MKFAVTRENVSAEWFRSEHRARSSAEHATRERAASERDVCPHLCKGREVDVLGRVISVTLALVVIAPGQGSDQLAVRNPAIGWAS
jgi:hypothetical protein